jgi:hypothetical protein
MLDILGHKGNENQNHIASHRSEWLLSITQTATNDGEDAGKNEPPPFFSTVDGNVN